MSIFGSIMSKLFPSSHPAVTGATAAPAAESPPAPGTALGATPPAASASASAQPTPSTQPPVDIEPVLEGLAAKNPEKLNWRSSIVDLMKLLDLDSSLASRKSLATELHYPGDQADSASMNTWLHKEVMRRVAANGGTVPAELKD